jgi:hypothetical protein
MTSDFKAKYGFFLGDSDEDEDIPITTKTA